MYYKTTTRLITRQQPTSQVGSPAAEEEGEEVGEMEKNGGERRGMQSKSTLESTAPKASSRSRVGEAMNKVQKLLECQQNSHRRIVVIVINIGVSYHSVRADIEFHSRWGNYRRSKFSNILQFTKEYPTPIVTDASHGLHMPESKNDSDTVRLCVLLK